MIDESMDTEQMKLPPQPYEFRAKPAYQRLLIMIGGVLFNFILALFIYSMVLFTWGESYYDVQKATYGMEFNENGKALGFVDGDILLKAGDDNLCKFDVDLIRKIVDEKVVTVLRNGAETTVTIPEEFGLLDIGKDTPFMQYRIPAVIDSILPGSPAALAGIMQGDSVTAIAGRDVNSWYKLMSAMDALKESGSRTVEIKAIRDGNEIAFTAAVDSTYKLGVMPRSLNYTPVVLEYGFFESFPAGVRYGCNVLKGYVSDFKYVFSSEGAKSVGMFGTIGSMFPSVWDWHKFWLMTAFLSIVLAFMNILPIPALDGGHVLFLLAEVVTGRKPSDKFLEYAQYAGMIILFGLMIYANFNDILRFLL
jgi:regulator of sigma E protease